MVSFTFLAAALAAFAPVFAHPSSIINTRAADRFGCAVEPTPEFLANVATFAQLESAGDNSTSINIADVSRAAAIVIDVYFHVVARSSSLSGGYIPQSQLTQQLAVMNSNYGKLAPEKLNITMSNRNSPSRNQLQTCCHRLHDQHFLGFRWK